MGTKKLLYNIVKIVLPLILGGGILYWMYRGFDFVQMRKVVMNEMDWTWMLLSMPFGILAQTFRGWRWKQVLEPMGEQTRNSVCVNSIFLSYAVSLVIPRVGEFARCGVLNRYDKVSFPKALGTVVTERAVDTVIVLLITAVAILSQIKVFTNFFFRTGTSVDNIFNKFSATGWLVTGICALAVVILLYIIRRHIPIYKKVKDALAGIWQGVISVKDVKNIPLFVFYSVAIWGSYFLHFYVLLFSRNKLAGCNLCVGVLRCWLDSSYCSNAKWCRTMAFCSEDNAYTLRCGRCKGTLFRANRAYTANAVGDFAWHLRLDSLGIHAQGSVENKQC